MSIEFKVVIISLIKVSVDGIGASDRIKQIFETNAKVNLNFSIPVFE
ncbi:hypothetical protein LC607_06380 [Nostoc sp. CHAB 5824]|nr:hypothetical protein [Nostoc sp. CHAB 5824]